MTGSVEILFSENLMVQLKTADRDERKSQIQLTIELHTVTSPLHKKELIVRLTDDADLFFLFTLRIDEEDFQSLKSQQGLLVDFGAFPQRFIDLLKLCLQEENKEIPKFVLHFVSTGNLTSDRAVATLNVIETNPFKHLTHLALKFSPGSDGDIKKYLADCLKKLKDLNGSLQKTLENTEADLTQRLRQTQEALSSRTIELDNIRSEWTARTNDLMAKHSQELTSEKEKVIQTQGNYQQRSERERKDLEQAHVKIVKQLEGHVYELEAANKELTDKKYKSDSTIRELKSRLSGLEEDHHHAKQEIQSLRKDNASLDREYHEKEKNINQLNTRVAVLEQECRDKEQVLARSSDLLGSEQDQKRKYEEELERKQCQISKMEASIKTMSEELIKANEIIKKLQNEIRNYHNKIKLRDQITTEQEKLLAEKEQKLEKQKTDLEKCQETLTNKEAEVKKLSESLETTVQKLDESRKLIKTNENVIGWLNRQINETQLSQPRHGMFEMPSTQSVAYRPQNAGLHNFNSPGYAPVSLMPSTIQHDSLQQRHQAHQVQRSNLPIPVNKSTPKGIDDIGETPMPSHRANKENDPPLDSKYLQKNANVPLRGIVPSNEAPLQFNQMALIQKPNEQLVAMVPRPTVKPQQQPPLASAYFPTRGKVPAS